MHFTEAKGILSASNGMNLCRGCTHGCIYCDSRSKCYGINHDFEDVEIKINAPALLEDRLRRKRQKCVIGTGAMSDPYIPIPESLAITRACLEIIEKAGYGLAIQTKSNLILRDLDLLKKINQKSVCVVQITLTTFDEDLCKILEPNVCTTKERYEVLKIMRSSGIPTVVWLCPILPFINDTEENLRGILDYCIEADVHGILCFGMGMTLREGDREYYYAKLDKHFPGLKKKYIQKYGNSYELSSDNSQKLMAIFGNVCKANNILYGTDEVFKYLHTFGGTALSEKSANEGQLALFRED
ncbi:MAG: radical SAM protein [Treponema sp.]|nr:radical SAM protein [Treponema sp.]